MLSVCTQKAHVLSCKVVLVGRKLLGRSSVSQLQRTWHVVEELWGKAGANVVLCKLNVLYV